MIAGQTVPPAQMGLHADKPAESEWMKPDNAFSTIFSFVGLPRDAALS
jgi:hypothetical protein